MKTPRIKQIEAFGKAVDEGLISRDEAAAELAAASDGGLTKVGAADVLGDWKGARSKYERTFDDAAELLKRLRGEP